MKPLNSGAVQEKNIPVRRTIFPMLEAQQFLDVLTDAIDDSYTIVHLEYRSASPPNISA